MRTNYKMCLALLLAPAFPTWAQDTWSLQRCIDHALEHNIQIQKGRIGEEQAQVTLWMNRGALLPSLSVSTSHSVGYRPFEENTALVQNGQVTQTQNKVTYQGSYGVNASWTVWNGGVDRKNIQAQQLQAQIAALGTEQSEMSIQEQIAQLYVQILYTQEAIAVNQKLQQTAQSQLERGQEMVAQGLMARADAMQLESQLAGAKYNVVNSQTQLAGFKRQLKALLEIGIEQDFNITATPPAEEDVLAMIPNAQEAYAQALQQRPEIKSAELGIEAANLNLDIARRGFLPTVSMSASVGDSHFSASKKSTGEQMKTNLNMSAGVTLRVPVFDNRRNRANVKQAKLQRATSQLDLQDKKLALGSTIEQYWLNACQQQQNYLAARQRVESQQASYEVLDEQFRHGLKSVVDVLQGRDNLISAEQDMLQSKYMTLLNIQLLKFYTGEPVKL